MKFKLVTGNPIHSHSSLPCDTVEAKSSEGLKIALKVWPSIQGFNIELVVFKEDFGRDYKSSCSRRVFDLTPSWFLLSEVWSMCLTPLTGMLLSHRVYSEQAGLSLGHPESSQKIYWTRASLGSLLFPKIFANTFALQAGIEDFKFTNDKKRAETNSRKYWFKSSWSLSGTAVINYSLWLAGC